MRAKRTPHSRVATSFGFAPSRLDVGSPRLLLNYRSTFADTDAGYHQKGDIGLNDDKAFVIGAPRALSPLRGCTRKRPFEFSAKG